jgi:hypothetical protein
MQAPANAKKAGKAAKKDDDTSTPAKKRTRKTGTGARSGANSREQGLALAVVKSTQDPQSAAGWSSDEKVMLIEHMISGSGNDYGRCKLIRSGLQTEVCLASKHDINYAN